MKLVFKYSAIALGVQAALLFCLGLMGSFVSPAVDTLFELWLRIYEPMILLIGRVGAFKGESAMIEPVWMGIVLGVLTYSLLIGLVALLLRSSR